MANADSTTKKPTKPTKRQLSSQETFGGRKAPAVGMPIQTGRITGQHIGTSSRRKSFAERFPSFASSETYS